MVGPSPINKHASPKPSALISPSIEMRENEEVSRPVATSIELSTRNSTSKSEEGWGPSTEHSTVIDSSKLSHGQRIALEEAMRVLAGGDKESALQMLKKAGIALYEDEKDNKSEDGGGSPAVTAQSSVNNVKASF